MTRYRIVFANEIDISDLPEIIECADDREVIEKAILILDGRFGGTVGRRPSGETACASKRAKGPPE